eukprot:m.83158 g.83158  ORF g.83158 m.83158 type:complete len:116 (-) comp8292_c1_seq1:345-692(-)
MPQAQSSTLNSVCQSTPFQVVVAKTVLFALANPSRHDVRRTDAEERIGSFQCKSFCQPCLACTWWSVQQETFPWASCSYKEMGDELWQHYGLLQDGLCVVKSDNTCHAQILTSLC